MKPLTVRVTVRLTADEAQALEEACRDQRLTRSDYVRLALSAFQRSDTSRVLERIDRITEILTRWEQTGWAPRPSGENPSSSSEEDAKALQASVHDLLGNW